MISGGVGEPSISRGAEVGDIGGGFCRQNIMDRFFLVARAENGHQRCYNVV